MYLKIPTQYLIKFTLEYIFYYRNFFWKILIPNFIEKKIIKKSQTYNFIFFHFLGHQTLLKLPLPSQTRNIISTITTDLYPLFPFLYHPSPLSTFSIFLHQSHFTIPHPFQHSPRNTLLLLKQQERYPRLTLTQRMKTNPLSKPDHTRFRILLIKTIYMSTFS